MVWFPIVQWKIGKLCFEFDTEPYALARDKQVQVDCLLLISGNE